MSALPPMKVPLPTLSAAPKASFQGRATAGEPSAGAAFGQQFALRFAQLQDLRDAAAGPALEAGPGVGAASELLPERQLAATNRPETGAEMPGLPAVNELAGALDGWLNQGESLEFSIESGQAGELRLGREASDSGMTLWLQSPSAAVRDALRTMVPALEAELAALDPSRELTLEVVAPGMASAPGLAPLPGPGSVPAVGAPAGWEATLENALTNLPVTAGTSVRGSDGEPLASLEWAQDGQQLLVTTSRPEVREAVLEALPKLREHWAGQGLKVDSVAISLVSGTASATASVLSAASGSAGAVALAAGLATTPSSPPVSAPGSVPVPAMAADTESTLPAAPGSAPAAASTQGEPAAAGLQARLAALLDAIAPAGARLASAPSNPVVASGFWSARREAPSGGAPAGLNPVVLTPAALNPSGSSPAGFDPTALNLGGLSPAGLSPMAFSPAGFNPTGFNPTGFDSAEALLRSGVADAGIREDWVVSGARSTVSTSETSGIAAPLANSANAAVQASQASGVPRSLPLDVPMQQADWDQALGQRIQWLVRENVQEARIRLNPREMGTIDIRIQVEGDRAHLQFVAAQPQAREALDAALPRLREMFAEGGITLGDVSVGREHAGRENASGESTGGGEGGSSDVEDAGAGTSSRQASIGMSLLDLYA